MLSQMFVVHFMRPPDRPQIHRIGIPENPEPLVDKYIVYDEIRETVNGNAQPDPKQIIKILVQSDRQKQNTGCCENDEEIVVFLKKITVVALVVIVV